MTDSNVVVPPEIRAMIGERDSLLAALAQGERALQELQASGSGVIGGGLLGGKASDVSALTSNPAPASELNAALTQAQLALKRINQLDRDISSDRAEISALRQRNMLIIGGLVVAGILVLVLLLHLVQVL